MHKPFTHTLNTLPTRDQAAWWLLSGMVNAGNAPADEDAATARAYRLADSYLSVARQSYRQAYCMADTANSDAAEKRD